MSDEDKLLTHDYDGIQEYDNDLPRWWRNIFWVTAIFAVFYFSWMHLGFKESQHDQLTRELRELDALKIAHASSNAGEELTDESLLKLAATADVIAKGKELYVAKCAACHGANSEGLVGPNLTDDFWIHGGTISKIRNTIVVGVPAKGMLAWGGLMTGDEINAAVSYIWSMHGTNPANPKAPEGELVKRGE